MKKAGIFLTTLALFLFFANINGAENEGEKLKTKFKEYFNEMSVEVKNAETPEAKREIISSSLTKMINALDKAESIAARTDEDRAFIAGLISGAEEKLNELNGLDGYQKVQDQNLNDFADYVQQDIEQADKYITISLTTLLLVAIIILLLA